MASSTKRFSLLFFIITFSSSIHARDSQFFNKAPATAAVTSTTANNVIPTATAAAATNNVIAAGEQPNFLPQDENTYGLYDHSSSNLTPSTTTAAVSAAGEKPIHDYFPKNYNPEAYVTQAEDTNESPSFAEENSFISNPNNKNNYNYNGGGGGGFNGRSQRFGGGGLQQEGMSDTRFMENGKYFYNVNTETYSRNSPYAGMREDGARNENYNNYNFYGNGGNVFENNEAYQSEDDQFEDEVKDLP